MPLKILEAIQQLLVSLLESSLNQADEIKLLKNFKNNLGEPYQNLLANYPILLFPKDAEIYYYRGVVYQILGQLELAIQDFERAMKFNPIFIVAWNNRIRVSNKIEEFKMK